MVDPTKYGAETSSDVAAFLIGAFAGGVVDAFVNVAGFAEPLVFASICGAGLLGTKKVIFDVPNQIKDKERQKEIAKLEWRAIEARSSGDDTAASQLERRAQKLRLE